MTNKINTNWIIILIVVVAVLIILSFFGFGSRSYGMMGVYNGGFMLFGFVLNILIIVLIIIGAYWLIKNMNHNNWSIK